MIAAVTKPDFITESDTSKTGWVGHANGIPTGGDWTLEEACEHISVLELRAACLTLQFFSSHSDAHTCIRLLMVNTTAVACIDKMGSTKVKLLQLTRVIFDWAKHI